MTPEDIRAFQALATDHTGAPLAVDGNAGPRTRWAMALSTWPRERVAIVSRAIGKLGLAERDGTNRHPEIDEWLARCGVETGHPWCAAFASWCIAASGLQVAVAGAQNLGRKFRALAPGEDPLPGDVMWYPTGAPSAGTGHCGVVIGTTLSEVMTVEGNLRNAIRLARRSRAAVRLSRLPLGGVRGEIPGIPPGVKFEGSTGLAGTR